MNNTQALIAILIIAMVTVLIRFAPFVIFGRKQTPAFIEYLGKMLPCAIMGMLVVYCLKDMSFESIHSWVPGIVGVGTTAMIQVWKRNTIYSIFLGTVIYMILIRVM